MAIFFFSKRVEGYFYQCEMLAKILKESKNISELLSIPNKCGLFYKL